MSNYSSQRRPPPYSYSIVRQYPPQPYYYSFNEYSSSPLLTHVSYTDTQPYSSLLKYYDDDDDETYLSEYYRHYHHSTHRQYSNNQKSTRARNISR